MRTLLPQSSDVAVYDSIGIAGFRNQHVELVRGGEVGVEGTLRDPPPELPQTRPVGNPVTQVGESSRGRPAKLRRPVRAVDALDDVERFRIANRPVHRRARHRQLRRELPLLPWLVEQAIDEPEPVQYGRQRLPFVPRSHRGRSPVALCYTCQANRFWIVSGSCRPNSTSYRRPGVPVVRNNHVLRFDPRSQRRG